MKRTIMCGLVGILVAVTACSSGNRTNETAADAGAPAPDNTATNERDRDAGALTPMDQGESEMDRTITQAIRQLISANDSLSVDAKNVKVITMGSVVTLRGPIHGSQERAFIVDAARSVEGVVRVDDQLELVTHQGN